MAGRTTMNISLSPALQRFIAAHVATGRYQSASEVVREGLRLLEERERDKQAALEDVRRKIAVGLEQLRRGEGLDGEAAFRELEARAKRLVRPPRRKKAG